MLLTFVVVLLIFQILNLTNSLIAKYREKSQTKLFQDICVDLNYYLKNLDYKGIYYFPIKVSFNGSYMIYKNNKCYLNYEFCNFTAYKEVILVKKGNLICKG
jgi:hypothetical protein